MRWRYMNAPEKNSNCSVLTKTRSLSNWHERTVTAEDVLRHVTASPRLQRIAAFCAEAQDRDPVLDAEELIRARARPVLRWGRERRARK